VRNYELVFIVHPDLESEGLDEIVERVQTFVEREGGQVAKVEPWGMRRLAYPIQDQQDGHYVLMHLELDPQNVLTLERNLKLTEEIMRHMIVRLEE
jgi:small subunit ribosomal protein S6